MLFQAEEKPTYENVFIHLGPFHIICAIFSLIGKYLTESGGAHILNETHVIEKVSLKSFLSGKSYNRCKRSHQLLGAAMEILHVQAFVDQNNGDRFKTVVSNELHTIHTEKTFTNILQEKNLMKYLSSINSIQRKHQKECMGIQPNSGLGILKCYTCITSLFEAFD